MTPSRFRQGGGFNNANGIGGEDTPDRLHLFEFPSGTRKEEVKNNNIHENTLLIPLTIATTEDYLEARWPEEILSSGKGLVRSWGQCGHMIFHSRLNQLGGVLYR